MTKNIAEHCFGIGGFGQAFKRINEEQFKVVFTSDIEQDCIDLCKLNYGIECNNDLRNLITLVKENKYNDNELHIMTAGFPCQPFSSAGSKRGLNDEVCGKVIFDLFKEIEKIRYELVFLENVPQLLTNTQRCPSPEDGVQRNAWEYINYACEKYGYILVVRGNKNHTFSPNDINIPQSRKRILLALVRRDLVKETQEVFIQKCQKTLETNIEKRKKENKDYKIILDVEEENKDDLIDDNKNSILDIANFIITHPKWDSITSEQIRLLISPDKVNRINYKIKHLYLDKDYVIDDNTSTQMRTLIEYTKKLYDNLPIFKEIYDDLYINFNEELKILNKTEKILEYSGGIDYGSECPFDDMYTQIRPSGIRIKSGKTFPTMTKSGTGLIINKHRRYTTIKEGLRLQSFPEDFQFLETSKPFARLGNAVNVQVIEVFIKSILENVY